jgi:hypothetical protein
MPSEVTPQTDPLSVRTVVLALHAGLVVEAASYPPTPDSRSKTHRRRIASSPVARHIEIEISISGTHDDHRSNPPSPAWGPGIELVSRCSVGSDLRLERLLMMSPDATSTRGRSLRSTISSSGELRLEVAERDVRRVDVG